MGKTFGKDDQNTLKRILSEAIRYVNEEDFDHNDFYGFLPEELHTLLDCDEYRSTDECIAVRAIAYPRLHELMRELVDTIADENSRGVVWDNEEEAAGGAMARELALNNKSDVILFARFISSNDLNHEVYQAEDMESVVAKWGACRETYSVAVARWLTPGQHRYGFDYDPIIDSIKSEDDVTIFMDAVVQWFDEGWFLPYNIDNSRDDVAELLTMIFKNLNYSRSEIEEIIDARADEINCRDENANGRSVMIQNKKTMEFITLAYDIDNTKMNVGYALSKNMAFEYASAEELNRTVAELETRGRELGYTWEVTEFPAMIDSIIEAYGNELSQPIDPLSLFTPEGEETPIDKMNAELLKGKKKIHCRKIQLFKSSSCSTMIFCDAANLRILDAGEYETESLHTCKTENEMLAVLNSLVDRYLEKGYELVCDEPTECPFDYFFEMNRQTAAFMKQSAVAMADDED